MGPTPDLTPSPELLAQPHAEGSQPVQLLLEITRGATRFPQRPVTRARFLIGAAAGCDLRLGGDQMPPLHCLIRITETTATLEAIAEEPPLTVNGQPVTNQELQDGDRIGIGPFELLARVLTHKSPTGSTPAAEPVPEVERALSELSASELIDLIEQEETETEDFETRRHLGLQALAQAILARSDRAGRDTVPAPHFLKSRPQGVFTRGRSQTPVRDTQENADLVDLGRQIASLSQEIRSTTERASQREAVMAAAAEDLLETQEKLVSQLEAVVDQVQTLKSESHQPAPRAIA